MRPCKRSDRWFISSSNSSSSLREDNSNHHLLQEVKVVRVDKELSKVNSEKFKV
jgi:hypothetical protein